MTANQAIFPVMTMAQALGVSRSGFYAYLGRDPSARTVADVELTERIKQIHDGSRGTYGAPRIHAELADEGIAVGRDRPQADRTIDESRRLERRQPLQVVAHHHS